MIESFVDVALPEEAAGEAYQIVKRELITPFEKWIGAGRVREHEWRAATEKPCWSKVRG